MSNDSTRKREEERNERERAPLDGGVSTCLHCGNPFLISEGVVTSDAALCDICNGD